MEVHGGWEVGVGRGRLGGRGRYVMDYHPFLPQPATIMLIFNIRCRSVPLGGIAGINTSRKHLEVITLCKYCKDETLKIIFINWFIRCHIGQESEGSIERITRTK